MKEKRGKSVVIISDDNVIVKLISFMLDDRGISTEPVADVGELNESARTGEGSPRLIIYDCNAYKQGEGLLCQPLAGYNRFEETPRVVLSTFLMDCAKCPQYRADRCVHIQKPFHIKEMVKTVRGLLDKKS